MARKATTKKSKTSLEPSEIFCAVGLLTPTAKMKELVEDNTGVELLEWAHTTGKTTAQTNIKPLDNKFVKMFDSANLTKSKLDYKKRTELVANIVAGFSAAIGIKKFMASFGDNTDIVNAVYMTGATWPQAVKDFRLQNEDSGFDYNSSDMVIEFNKETYYGISLKKKKNVQAKDPTLINKAYSTFLEGLDDEREKLNEIRQKYFPNIIRKAQQAKIINMRGLGAGEGGLTDKEIWEFPLRKPAKPGKTGDLVYLINLKGYTNEDDDPIDLLPNGIIEQNTLLDVPTGRMGLRDFINNDLAKPNNELYAGFHKVLKKKAGYFAQNLIDITLKTKMATKLVAKDLKNMHFEFGLVTGYANYTPVKKNPEKDKLVLEPAKVYPQHSILCGLANLAGGSATYFLELDKAKKEAANAAKLFYKLGIKSKGKQITILDVELRYKGDFKQSPQFFATISEEFVTQIHEECLVRT